MNGFSRRGRNMQFLKLLIIAVAGLAAIAAGIAFAQKATPKVVTFPLDRLELEHPRNVKTEVVTFRGKKALRVTDTTPVDVADGIQLVLLDNIDFKDGTIEVLMSGVPKSDSTSSAPRGFVGIAFRLSLDPKTDVPKYDGFYLRPTNGRSDDQLRRNHATQYISYPDRPWFKLRKENPGLYESYADMEAGPWIKVKVEVHDKKANLYVGDSSQPSLVVNDLTQEKGSIALWVGTDTVAHFADLRVTPSRLSLTGN